uniref:Histone-binding protein RBBP4-like N-terminal domain-containing protein n=3 Tax=Rhodosorus marinus TaxID=101924 RepID=A0A7S2ZQW7_9RHOD|mmetsp:Transcript_25827/g.101880  ORF Transcript_25827/g.101880 Transcript_25827/m.101880 type:complete len:408 (+) Transcript_25827:225-1448(+)
MNTKADRRTPGFDQRREHWKHSHVPLLYDWMLSRKCPWPSACVQFGLGYDSRDTYTDRTLYLSERTGETGDANTLYVASARVANEHATRSADVTKKWSENVYRDPLPSSDFRIKKKIIHPGEVNRVRELREGVVVTHTDHPNLFVWDIERQPHRKDTSKGVESNVPDLTLVGHQANAEYAVESVEEGKIIASGGKDKLVLIWQMEDYETLLSSKNSHLLNRTILRGHSDTVEGLAFNPEDSRRLVSGGDDKCVFFWDTRKSAATGKINDAHQGDVNCVDWSHNGMYIASGGADQRIRIWDVRQLSQSSEVTSFADLREHTGQINEVQFQPCGNSSVLGSCAEDGQVLLWDIAQVESDSKSSTGGEIPSLLLFRHYGHQYAVSEFQWSTVPDDPWTIASVSEDEEVSH